MLLTVERGVQELFDEHARTARSGLVLVKTTPPGASIYIDGERVGVSPFNAEIDLGEHEVRAELGELAGSEIVFVEPQGVTRVQLDLKQPLVEALFLSDPPEARVYIDGAYAGETPLRVRELRSGEREVVVELDGYLTDRRQMAVSRAEYELRGR
ncbi:MAG: PEGA domain-containing protein [Deltaproteobacteria bacterium]